MANLSVSQENHERLIRTSMKTIIGYSRSRDVRCRQHSMFTLGNLAANPANLQVLMEAGCLPQIISFAFPGDPNVQFQAVAALRGLAVHPEIRLEITRHGGLEPLILAAHADNIEIQREVAAALCNIALNEENKVQIARSGCLPALVQRVPPLAPVLGADADRDHHLRVLHLVLDLVHPHTVLGSPCPPDQR